jgi:glycyl-tRNA synthetase beta chain
MAALLVELLVEELPPKALKALGQEFASGLARELVSLRSVEPEDADKHTSFATPRRLAVLIPNVVASTLETRETRKLMPRKVAFGPDGVATPALHKKLRSLGYSDGAVPADDLVTRTDGDAEYVYLDQVMAGRSLAANLQMALEATLRTLPIPKVMEYQLADGWTSVKFVRPAHGLVALHGSAVVQVTALGLDAGRATLGHRFEAKRTPIAITSADTYVQQLLGEGAVIPSFAERRAEIARQLEAAAAAEQGLKPISDDALLDEVTALVERPNVLACEFEREYLAVPPECLVLTMKANQKYFPLLEADGSLSNRFLVVSNITPADPSRIIEGNERVVRPRLADAKFFFDQDRKKTLASRVPALDRVVYHARLGSQGERTMRVRDIAGRIAAEAFANEKLSIEVDRAAELAKADLSTDMVGEFPELQGIMGGYYARHDGESVAVAEAIEDHYKPRFAGDSLPRNKVGVIVALADKLEVLVGLFGIGQLPTGDKDPFALRRQALGVIRMLIEVPVPIGLERLVALALPAFGTTIKDPSDALLAFVYERLAGNLREQGFSAQEVDAVLSRPPAQLADLKSRLDAVRAFAALPEAASLAAANKRVGNILKKSRGEASPHVDVALLHEPAEAALHAALLEVEPKAERAFAGHDYSASLQALAALKTPVDAFFDAVMVNVDDPGLRANRLGLLGRLHSAMNRVADLSKLAG